MTVEETALQAHSPDGSGGAGLYGYRAASTFPRWLGWTTGLVTIAVTLGVAYLLYVLNPAFASGAAAGAPDQLGAPPAVAGGTGAGADAAAAKQIIGAKGCGGCHTIPGIASAKGTVGPDLAGVASRKTIAGGAVPNNGPEDIKKWILDPPALKPGTAMPNLHLTEQEAETVAQFLETLK